MAWGKRLDMLEIVLQSWQKILTGEPRLCPHSKQRLKTDYLVVCCIEVALPYMTISPTKPQGPIDTRNKTDNVPQTVLYLENKLKTRNEEEK